MFFYLLAFVFVIFINYMQIRDIIFSILRGSTSPKRARKIRKNQSFKDRVTMRYIAQYTKKNKKELTFYFFIKSIYVIFSIILYVVGIILVFTNISVSVIETFFRIYLIVQVVLFLWLRIQFGADGWFTRFDRKK